MKIEKIKISDLRPAEKNVRIHGNTQLKEFERSIRMFGQIRPVVVDENNMIVCGNGLYETMKNMGLETIDAYRVSDLTDKQKKKLMISDNKIYSLGVDNLDVFDEFLRELRDDLDIPGYDDKLLQSLVSDAEEITEKLSEYGTIDDSEIKNMQARAKESDEPEEPAKAPDNQMIEYPSEKESEEAESEDDYGPAAEQRKFVICPKCGEKIWL